jgi:hypothetical protein
MAFLNLCTVIAKCLSAFLTLIITYKKLQKLIKHRHKRENHR